MFYEASVEQLAAFTSSCNRCEKRVAAEAKH